MWTYSTGPGWEYDDIWMLSNGNILFTRQVRGEESVGSVRLKNGNTLITDDKDILTLEANPQRETVWALKPDDIPEAWRFINTQSATRLANGNTIICSRGGNGKGPQLVEVTPNKKVVWVLWDWANFGPATAVQILNDPGYPEIPGHSQH